MTVTEGSLGASFEGVFTQTLTHVALLRLTRPLVQSSAMQRRDLLKGLPLAAAAAAAPQARAALPKMKITRVRYYEAPNSRPIFNQSSHIVVIETDQGITGIGEGGSPRHHRASAPGC